MRAKPFWHFIPVVFLSFFPTLTVAQKKCMVNIQIPGEEQNQVFARTTKKIRIKNNEVAPIPHGTVIPCGDIRNESWVEIPYQGSKATKTLNAWSQEGVTVQPLPAGHTKLFLDAPEGKTLTIF